MSKVKIRDLLHGCTPGRIQTVGMMSVIPLLSEIQDDRFASPARAKISTSGYGKLVIRNEEGKAMLVPSGATYIVDQAAQNHGLGQAGWVKANAIKTFNTAMCVQQSQAGYIRETATDLRLLPLPLRFKAHGSRRNTTEFQRLWPDIAAFNAAAGCRSGSGGHLEYFFGEYKDQLDSFVAQFEPVPQQVGAIVIIAGKVVGVERCPSENYFRELWRPLLRDCYGGMAVVEARKHKDGNAPVPRTRVSIKKPTSLSGLRQALADAETEEKDRVSRLVNSVLDVSMSATVDEKEDLTLEAFTDRPFVGQAIRDGGRVVYCSLVADENAAQKEEHYMAAPFKM